MEKVEKLEKEIKELKFKITNLEERVLNTETFISFIKNNINSAPVKDSTNPFLGLKSNLTISEPLETLMNAIYSNTVPISQEHSSFQNISNMGLAENNINPEPVSPEEVPLESNDNNDNFPVLSPVLSTTNSTQSPNTNILPEVNDILEKNENNTEINDISDNENSTEANNIPENENNSEVNNVSDNENDDEINSIHDNENISEVNNIHDNENDIVANNISDNESNAEVNNISDNENNSEVNNIHDNENDTEVNNISDNVNNAEVNNISDNRNISEVNNIHDNENDTVANNIFDNENDDKINNISDNESNTINQYIVDKNILKATKNINTESWIGKILMGALASLLVFIALITFAKALLPYLTNTLKIALMFVSSIALTATGYVFNTKKPKNTFYKALLACGSACIYLSILMTRIYFKAVSSIGMYVLIALWAVLNIFFKKDKNNWLFFAIGNLGYLVSIIFSQGLKTNDESLIIPLLIYVVMISVIYQIMYWKNVYQRHIQNIINIISLLLLQYIITSKFNEITEVIIVGLATIAYIFIYFIKYTFIDLLSYKKEDVYIKIVSTSLYFLCIYMSIFVMGTYFKSISLIVTYVLITLWTILNIFFKKDKTDWFFFAVGNIGYLGSILSSAKLSINDKSFITPVFIYVVMISLIYQIMYWKNVYQRHIQNIINIIYVLLFQYIITSIFNEITEVIIVGLVTITFIFIYFIKYAFIDLLSYKEEDDYIEIVIKTVIKIVSTSLYLLCIYKSIFIMGTYFKTTSLIVMYVLTTLWTLLNIFFKKDKDDWLFFAVGNIGYLGSILSSVDLSINDKSIIIPTLIYVIIISVVYQIMYWKNIYQRHIQNIINIISLLLFQHIIASIFNEIPEVIIVGLITIAFIFIYFIKHTFIDLLSYKNEDVNIKIVSTSLYLLCIYMSISVLGTYFKTVSLIVIYVLTTLWTILNIFFKKDKTDRLFFAVGNIGYLGSILSSVDLSINDKFIIIPTLIYALMISVVYQIMYWKNECQRHIQSIINVLSLLIFHFIITSIFRKTTEFTIVTITTIVFALIGSIQYTMFDFFIYKKEHFYIALLNISVYFLTYIRLNNILKLNLPAILTFIVIIIPTILLEIINMYWRSKNLADIDKNIVNDVLSSILFYEASFTMGARNHFLYSSGIILAVYSSIMIYGIIKKDSFFKNQAWILLSLCMYSEKKLFVSKVYEFDGNNLPFTVVAVILLLVFLIVEGFVLNDSETYKLISYFAVLSWIIRTGVYAYNYYTSSYFTGIIYYTQVKKPFVIDKEYIINITYGIIALLNMVLILTKFYKLKERKEINTLSDILNDEKKTCIRILLDIFNLTFMLFGVIMMYVSDSNIQLQIIYMVIVLLLAFINLPVKDAANRERYIYTAVKFSFLIYYSLWIFKIENYVTSISMIAFAVVCIAIGFWNRLIGKELRIYGLVMTIIFVIKLIIIDISYDSSVLKASSYLMSGGLCFGISAIYNYFEDNNNNNNNNNNNDNDKKNN